MLTLAKQTMNAVFPGLMMALRLLFGFLVRNVTMSTMTMVSCMERSSWLNAVESSNHFMMAVLMITLCRFHLKHKIPACRIHI